MYIYVHSFFQTKNTAYVSIECIEYLPVPMIPENVSTNDIAQKDVDT